MLKLSHVSRIFNSGATRVEALKDISLDIEKGSFAVITGRSGSGKSTLMQVLGLLDRADAGQYFLNGQEVGTLQEKQQSAIRLKEIGFVHQSFYLLPHESAVSNVALPLGYLGYSKKERVILAEKALERVGLQERLYHNPTQLSGGEQQRVAIARAIVTKPNLILADEPTGNLDSKNGLLIHQLLRRLHQEGQTIVMVTHDQGMVREGDKHIVLKDGHLQSS